MTEIQIWTTNFMAQIYFANLNDSFIKWNDKSAKLTGKTYIRVTTYSLNKKEWTCSLFKEWILEKSEIRVNLVWTFVLFTHFGVTTGIIQGFRVIQAWGHSKMSENTNVHSKFTLISLFSKIPSLKSEHIHYFFCLESRLNRYCIQLNRIWI